MCAQALQMFTGLCMFEEAKQLAEQAAAGQLLRGAASRGAAAVAELMGRQAAWSEETANYEAAAEMYIKVCRVLLYCAPDTQMHGAAFCYVNVLQTSPSHCSRANSLSRVSASQRQFTAASHVHASHM